MVFRLPHPHRPKLRGWHCMPLDPSSSPVLAWWDLLGAALLVVVAIWTPLEVSFLSCTRPGEVRWYVNQVVNLFFFFDMVLQFFMTYPVTTPYGSRLVYDLRKIAMHYLKSWFFIDFISVFPFELIAPCGALGALRVVRLLRLLKMLRLLRGLRVFQRWQTELGFSYRKMMLYCIFGVIVIAAHWIACALGLISRLQGFRVCILGYDDISDAELVDVAPCVVTWLTEALGPKVPHRHGEVPPEYAYVAALHTSMSILVHPHHSMPTGLGEQISFIVLMLLGGFLWTQVISRSTALCTSLDRHNINYHQLMDDVNQITSELGLTSGMRKRLRKFFLRSRRFTQHDTWQSIVRRLSPQLKRDAFCELNRSWVLRIEFISRCSRSFITDVSEALRAKLFSEHEYLGEPFHLYILVEGLAARSGGATRMRMLTPGAVWGEDHLLLTSAKLLEDNTALALRFVQCQTLSKSAFEEITESYPEHQEHIRRTAVKMAVVRGVIAYANWLLEPEPEMTHLRTESEESDNKTEMLQRLRRRRQNFINSNDRAGDMLGMSGSFKSFVGSSAETLHVCPPEACQNALPDNPDISVQRGSWDIGDDEFSMLLNEIRKVSADVVDLRCRMCPSPVTLLAAGSETLTPARAAMLSAVRLPSDPAANQMCSEVSPRISPRHLVRKPGDVNRIKAMQG